MSDELKVSLLNSSEVIANLKSQISRGVTKLELPSIDFNKYRKFETSNNLPFALFHNGKPVSFNDFVNLHLQAFANNKTAEEEDLMMVESQALARTEPEKYQAWLELSEKSGGLDTVSSYWKGTKPSRILELNKQLNATGSQVSDASLYAAAIDRYGIANTPVFGLGTSLQMILADKTTAFTKLCNSFISTYLMPGDSPKYSESLGNQFMGGAGKIVAFKCSSNIGEELLMYGSLYFNPSVGTDKSIKIREETINILQKNSKLPAATVSSSIGEIEVGHGRAIKSQKVGNPYLALVALRNEIAATPNPDADDKKLLDYFNNLVEEIRPHYEMLRGMDKVFISPSAISVNDGKGATRVIKTNMPRLAAQASALGANEILIVREDNGVLHTEVKTLSFNITAYTFFAEWGLANGVKGGYTKAYGDTLVEVMKSLGVGAGIELLFEEGSSSVLEEMLLESIQKVLDPFDDSKKMISKKIVKRGKKPPKTIVKHKFKQPKKSLHAEKGTAIAALVDKKVKDSVKKLRSEILKAGSKELQNRKNKTKSIRGTLRLSEGSNIHLNNGGTLLAVINNEIRDAVISQMKRPALVNRTGQFAASVKVTSVDEAGIKYSYKRDPYAVFSRKIGVGPWNSVKERDPHTIIRNAINSIILTRFPTVLKTNILERP